MTVVQIPKNRRYWLIRAGTNSGEFYEHFKSNKLVAVGHADLVDFAYENGHELTDKEKEHVIGAAAARVQERAPGKQGEATRLKSQLNKFLLEVNVGDTVITLKESSQVLVGVVRSKPFYSNVPLYGRNDEDVFCYYSLRMAVDWGRYRSREQVPLNLDKTLRIPHTIAEFKEPQQVRTLNHWLYPIHSVGNEVRCSLRIASESDLSNRQITKLSQTLDTLEELSSFIEYATLNHIPIDSVNFKKYLDSESVNYSIKTQHLFMSPGYNFIQVPGSSLKQAVFVCLLIMSFGVQSLDAAELPNNLDVTQVTKLMNEVITTTDIVSIKAGLEVSLPKQVPAGRTEQEDMGITLEDNSADSDPVDGTML